MGIEQIKGLVDRFAEHRDEYTSGKYNETASTPPTGRSTGWCMSCTA